MIYYFCQKSWHFKASRLILNYTYMDASTKEDIKKALLQRKKDLEEELAKISHQEDGSAEANYSDIGDDDDENAQEVTQYADNQSLVAQLSKSLDDVTKSLEKIDSGDYGICKYCKKDINPERLKVRPSSGSCIDCKATLQGEKR